MDREAGIGVAASNASTSAVRFAQTGAGCPSKKTANGAGEDAEQQQR